MRGFKHLSGVQRYCSNYIAVVALKSVLVLIHQDAVDMPRSSFERYSK